ncbi:hypothetical protein [Apilactobacillus xinyiensis]|uniref:hypothetical protein n=1 Tax=Apilactobacillus xinyiensis TaxID=2841032 RepID=UPI001C7D409E|nr:hypothetical protein [Apilactobacillus xinyiensis]
MKDYKGILFYYNEDGEKIPVKLLDEYLCEKMLNKTYRKSEITIIDKDDVKKKVNPFYLYHCNQKKLYLMYKGITYRLR